MIEGTIHNFARKVYKRCHIPELKTVELQKRSMRLEGFN
jgi:hypothetical protein